MAKRKRIDDWKLLQKMPRFAWKSTNDPKYIKDRDEFFAEHGNGWWWTEGGLLKKVVKR